MFPPIALGITALIFMASGAVALMRSGAFAQDADEEFWQIEPFAFASIGWLMAVIALTLAFLAGWMA